MMIHTSLTGRSLYQAALTAQVTFARLDESGSRTHARKFDVLLSGSSGRRAGFGADHEAASWDEWGIFLDQIFRLDPDARAAGYYTDREQFRRFTGHRFDTLAPADQHRRHRWVRGEDYSQGCTCGAIRRWDPPRQRTGSGPVRPDLAPSTNLHRWAEAMDALPMRLGEIFGESMGASGSRYDSGGRYAADLRGLGDRDTDALLIEIGELVDDD